MKGKTILIVGAGGLLGGSLVLALLKQEASVIAADINHSNIQGRLTGLGVDINDKKLVLTTLDITNEASVKSFFDKLDHVDGAVNTTYPRNKAYGAHFFDVSLASFIDNLSLHLGSAFLFTQQCAEYFKLQQTSFSLVNISSIYGVIAPRFEIYQNTPMTMPVEYAAIKAAIQHLSRYVVAYVNDSRFRVNCVSPGGIFDDQPESFLKAYKKETNGGGMLDVNEVVGSVIYLLSEQSRYVTGQNIIVDDGFSL